MYQPDGTAFLAKLKGDETCKVLMTSDGHAILKGEDGYYSYARFNEDGSMESIGYRVGGDVPSIVLGQSRDIPWSTLRAKTASRRREMVSRPSTRAGIPTKRHCIIILAQFPDLAFRNEGSRRQDFVDLITKEGSGSVLDYFNDQFMGSCEFNFTIGPIVTLSKDHDYYGKNQDGEAGQDAHPQELVKEACILSSQEVDFSQFDDDGDGYVDNVFVIVAGKSEAEGGDSDCMWPHQWYVPDLVLNGKRIFTYALSTELSVQSQSSSGQLVWGLCSIGTFCHEYGHTLGLFDMYDTDGEGSGGESRGLWYTTALMDAGNYNDMGRTPPYFNAIDREILGIGNGETMHAGAYTLEPINENGRYLILENPSDPMEFFLFECRAQKGWDAYIGGSGLAIYHIDMTKNDAGWSDDAKRNVSAIYRWEYNEVNCNPSFECADMIETSRGAMSVRQAFFPYRTYTSFTANSSPAFRFNDGTESPFAISDIKKSGDNVTFTVYDSAETVPKATGLEAETYQDAAILTWASDVKDYEGEATVTWGPTSGSSKTVTVSAYSAGRYSATLEGLSPTTAYSATVVFKRGDVSGDVVTCDFMTKAEQSGKKPYIFFEYLSEGRSGGKFPQGVGLPLRVCNAIGESVSWSYDGAAVHTDGSGYFHPSKSGTLKAVISHSDGSRDILSKEITLQ